MVGPPSPPANAGREAPMKTTRPSEPSGPESVAREAWPPLLRVARLARRPLERFLRIEAASGILLVVTAAAALAWANSAWGESYVRLWQTPLGVHVGTVHVERSLSFLVNDGSMTIFFFVVGLEIRRELHHGDLSGWGKAAVPLAAALGGMLVPAGLYLAVVRGHPVQSGWGIPMATDIAFALGVFTLLGRRIPAALRVLLLALAVLDDVGAIVIIAVFYSSGLSVPGLCIAALALTSIFVMQRLGVRSRLAYAAPSVVAWLGVYRAGIHPTIAGVAIGLLTPSRAWLGPSGFVTGVRRELDRLTSAGKIAPSGRELSESLRHVQAAHREALSPAESLIETLHPWVAFAIMPLFALANAGVRIEQAALDGRGAAVALGIVIGLVVGKPLGVVGASWVTLRLGLGTLPRGLGPRHLVVLGSVAGVGFTMALFIGQLAFSSGPLSGAAKLGILSASSVAALLGIVLGMLLLSSGEDGAFTEDVADQAERATAE